MIIKSGIRALVYMVLPLLIVPSPPVLADSGCIRRNLMETVSEEERKLLEMFGGDWWKDAEVCVAGPYRIAVPAKRTGPTVFIWKESGPFLMVEEGFGLGVFGLGPNPDRSELLLTIQDWNKDGIYDRLDHKIFDDLGEAIGDATDLNMDGQTDLKIFLQKKKGQIWFQGEWRDLHLRGNRRGVLENGEFKAVEFKNGSWIYSE